MAERQIAPDELRDEPDVSPAAPAAPEPANGSQPRPGNGSVLRRPRWRGYTAFVLSGGTARGALQIGALRALIEYGERPDLIVGTSIGAWNGSVLARDPSLATVEQLADFWRGAHSMRVLLGREPYPNSPPQATRGILMLAAAQRVAANHPSLYSDVGLKQLLAKTVGDQTFEDLAIPLRIIATDITHGERAVFSSGPLAPAILASSAIPGVFPPVRIGDAVYVDGGAVDNASLETALALGARRIFVLDVGYDESNTGAALWTEETAPVTGARAFARGTAAHALAAVLERSVQAMSRYQLSRALQRVPRGIETHVISAASGTRGGSLDFERAPAWIEHGYQMTVEYLRSHVAQRVAVEG